jgi:putative SOS response-associated peptidase YedK
MCGRFTITVDRVEFILEKFKAELAPNFEDYRPRYNAAPGQILPAIVSREGRRYLTNVFWGFLPPWGEKEGSFIHQANIRDDTIARNKFFRDRLIHNRCVFIVDGFYEWKLPEGYASAERGARLPKGMHKTPYRIHLKNNVLFPLAGLWRTFSSQQETLISAGIITTSPNSFMATLHHRMPVLLSDTDLERWLDSAVESYDELIQLLDPYPAEEMKAYAVSPRVNNSHTDSPSCLEPAL